MITISGYHDHAFNYVMKRDHVIMITCYQLFSQEKLQGSAHFFHDYDLNCVGPGGG
jgi:hypothetical protein